MSKLPPNQQPLAIVGMGCRLPGGSNLDAYWEMIHAGKSAIGVLPESRLNQSIYYSEKLSERPRTLTRLGGIVDPYIGIRSLHKLTSADIVAADASHLEMVSVMEDAVAHAGWNDQYFQDIKTGVYVGHTRGTGRTGELVYRSLIPHTAEWLKESSGFDALDCNLQNQLIHNIVQEVQTRYAGRDRNRPESLEAYQGSLLLAKAFGLDGPAISLNAACASSLIALSMAGHALRLGKIDVAVVGSGSYVEFDSLVLFSRAGSVSQTGSRPFDAGADGLVAAEGYIVLLLKTLERAIEDRDPIVAVIRGMGYSSDGRGKSLWAPRKEGQILAIQRAFGETLTPTRLQYLEAHATSTAVGDATEMSALSESLEPHLRGLPRIPIGSVKANIGHTLESAGLAGLVKTVLAINAKTIPPVSYIKTPNTNVDWERAPFYLPKSPEPWAENTKGFPRRAGVNAFGIGGLNAHIVIDEYVPGFGENYFSPDIECIMEQSNSFVAPANALAPKASSKATEKVAIIGIGIIAAGGNSAEAFWNGTKSGQRWLVDSPEDRFSVSPTSKTPLAMKKIRGGFLRSYLYDWRKHKVPPKQVANADPLQFMLLDAVDQALQDTNIPPDELPRARTGAVIGSIFGGEFGNALQMGLRLPEFSECLKRHLEAIAPNSVDIEKLIDSYQALLLSRMPALVDETGSFTSSTLASRITKSFDIMGGGVAIDAGGSSGIAALELCINALVSNDADLMICAAGQRSCGQFVLDALIHSKAISSSGDAKVWSESSDGLAPAEGAGVVILKRLSDAERDGNKIYSVIEAVEIASGKNLAEAYIKVDQALKSLMNAAPHARLAYIEAAANGGKHDNFELQAITEVFSDASKVPIDVCALKEQIGEAFGAAGLMSIIRASLALQAGTIPAVSNFHEKKMPDGVQCFETPEVIWSREAPTPGFVLVHAACERFASGVLLGNISAVKPMQIVLPTTDNEIQLDKNHFSTIPESRPLVKNRIHRFAADSVSELLHMLNEATEKIDNSGAAIDCIQAMYARSHRASEYRINIVANQDDQLKSRMHLAIHAMDNGKSLNGLQNQGIFFGRRSSQPNAEIAFVFSGQGSQYGGMLTGFIEHDDCAKKLSKTLDEILLEEVGRSLESLLVDSQNQLGKDLESTQLAILSCELLLFEKVKRMGIIPQRLAGHSFGEYGAMYAAGCWDAKGAIRAALKRSNAVKSSNIAEGQLICAFCDEQMANQACDASESLAFVANCNTSNQTVIGGSVIGLDHVKAWLSNRRIRSTTLNVPFAFHTPLMEPASLEMKRLVSDLNIREAETLLLSTVSESYESCPEKLRTNLIEQLVKPVRWTRLIQSLYQDGVRMFVEIGPSQVLTTLVRHILKDRHDVICVASDDPKSTIEEQLVVVEAANEIQEYQTRTHVRSVQLVAQGNSMECHTPRDSLAKQDLNEQDLNKQAFSNGQESSTPHATEEITEKYVKDIIGNRSFALATNKGLAESCNQSETISPLMTGELRGQTHRQSIRSLLQQTIAFPTAKLSVGSEDKISLDRATEWMGQEGIEELRGLSRGAWATEASLLRLNLHLATSLVGDRLHYCSVPHHAHDGKCLQGFTEILPYCLKLELQRRRPAGYLKNIIMGVSGQIGGLAGMNESQLTMSSAMLSNDRLNHHPGRDGTFASNPVRGLLQPIVTMKVLQEATSIDGAIDLCRSLKKSGAWGVMLLDAKTSLGAYVEFDDSRFEVKKFEEAYTASNHFQLLASHERPATESLFRIQQANLALNRLNGTSGNPLHVWRVFSSKATLDSELANTTVGFSHPQNQQFTDPKVQAVLLDPSESKIWISSPSDIEGSDSSEPMDFSSFFGKAQDDRKHIRAPRLEVPITSIESERPPSIGSGFQSESQTSLFERHRISAAELSKAGNSLDGKPPLGDEDRICTRLLVKLVQSDVSQKSSELLSIAGLRFLILGNNAVSHEVANRLSTVGAEACTLAISDDSSTTLKDYDDLVDKQGIFDGLLVMNAWDSQPAEGMSALTANSMERDIVCPYLVAQKWFSRLGDSIRSSPAFFVTGSRMGGDLGLAGTSPLHSGGALSGLSKAMSLERSVMVGPDLRTHAIDFSLDAPSSLIADCIIAEFHEPVREAEIAYQDGKRFVVRMIQAPFSKNNIENELPKELREGCWIVTGGARGVTAEIAKALGTRVHGTIHLVGSSPLPQIPQAWLILDDLQTRELRTKIVRKAVQDKKQPADAWSSIEKAIEISKNLEFMRQHGLKVKYHACDITNAESVRHLLVSIRGHSEPVVGVVHGAGFEKASRFSGKKLPLVMRTIESKVLGAINLMTETLSDPIHSFIAFTSISGRYGAIGQTDYGLANEWLTKVIARYRFEKPSVHAVALDWHSWGEVGMAARPETKHSALLKTMRFMPVVEGVTHFLNEVAARSDANEIVLTDWYYHKLFFVDPVTPLPATRRVICPQTDLTLANVVVGKTNNDQASRCVLSFTLEPVDPLDSQVPLDGAALIVGNSKAATTLQQQLILKGVDCLRVSLPKDEAEWTDFATRLDSTQSNANLNHLFVMTAYDTGARIGGGWNQHQSRMTHGLIGVSRLIDQWIAYQKVRSSVSKPSHNSLIVGADFGGLFGIDNQSHHRLHSPESARFIDWVETVDTNSLEENLIHLNAKVVDISTTLSLTERARIWIAEAEAVDGIKCVAHSETGRFQRKQSLVSNEPSVPTNGNATGGTWIVVGKDPLRNAEELERMARALQSKLFFIDTSKELLQADSPLERLQGIHRKFSQIRKQCDDSISGILVLDCSDQNANSIDSNSWPQIDTLKLVCDIIEVTRADALRSFVVLHGCNNRPTALAREQSSEAFWLRWYQSDRKEIQVKSIVGLIDEKGELIDQAGFAVAKELLAERKDWQLRFGDKIDDNKSSQTPLPTTQRTLAFAPKIVPQDSQMVSCIIELNARTDPFLSQHLFRGKPLMPIVGILELIWQSAVASGIIESPYPISIENLEIVNGFKFLDSDAKTVRVLLKNTGDAVQAKLAYDFYDSKGKLMEQNRPIATASIVGKIESIADISTQPSSTDPWYPVTYPGPEMIIYHGPAFRCLDEVQHFAEGLWGRFTAQASSELGGQRPGEWLCPMGVLDSALFACGVLGWTRDPKSAAIPASIERVKVYSQTIAGENYLGKFTLRSIDETKAIFDGMICDSNGKVTFVLEGFTATLVNHNMN